MTPADSGGFRLTSDDLAIGLVFTVIGALALNAPAQSDTWWLLRAGRDILDTHHIPLVETYSHTATGSFWPNHEWLTEVIFAAVHAAGGMPAVALTCAAAILATWSLCWRMTTGPFEWRFLAFAGSVATSASVWALRPQAFSMLAFLATAAVMARGRGRWWLPLLFVVWANLHGAVALGLVAIAGALAADVVRERRAPWNLVGLWLVAWAATLATPLGWSLWSFIPESMARSRVNELIEWLPPDLAPGFWLFWILAAAFALALARRFRDLDAWGARLAGMSLATLPLALQARRNVPIFLLVAVPALTALLRGNVRDARRPSARGENYRVNAALLAAAMTAAAAMVILAWLARAPHLGWTPITSDAVTAIRACAGPLYNTYGDGGVLIWFAPERPVFIDNRQDPYPLDVLSANHALEMTGDYEATFATYGIQCAVVPESSPTAERLSRAREWTRAYQDTRWTVFARRR